LKETVLKYNQEVPLIVGYIRLCEHDELKTLENRSWQSTVEHM